MKVFPFTAAGADSAPAVSRIKGSELKSQGEGIYTIFRNRTDSHLLKRCIIVLVDHRLEKTYLFFDPEIGLEIADDVWFTDNFSYQKLSAKLYMEIK